MSLEEKKAFNKYTGKQIQVRRLERKLQLILIKGGECQKCGYKKNYSALQFHHRNPKEKLFGLDCRNIGAKNWESLLKEMDKCDLLCGNCHSEYHYPHCLINNNNEDYQI
jgi:5-methylcytosine-specific restriction endonuclease McrA